MESNDTTSKRIPLSFPLDESLRGEGPLAPPSGLLEHLKQQLDLGIYTWDPNDFPIPFPDTLPRTGPAVKLENLLRDPDYNQEIEELAFDNTKRSLRKLDFLQFQEIRNTGEFSVPSVKFPGQVHVWRLTQLLQKGHKRVLATARQELAFALTNILIWIPNRLYKSKFSIPHGVKLIFHGIFWDLPSLLLGLPEKMPEFMPFQVEAKIAKKKSKFLLEELKFGSEYNPSLTTLEANQVTTMDGKVFDFRLFNSKILEKVRNRLAKIQAEVEAISKKRAPQLQQQISAELKRAGGNEADYAQEIANRLENEKQRLLEEAIRTDAQLEKISPLISVPIMEMLEADRIALVADDELGQRRDALIAQTTAELKAAHPILSLIPQWLEEKVGRVVNKFNEETKYAKLERCISMAHERKLEMVEYLFRKRLHFEKEREEGLRKSLSSRKVPARVYTFARTIWNPKNWLILREALEPGKPYYYAKTYVTSEVTSDTWFWRWRTMFYRTGTFWNNSLYSLYRSIVQGPLGFRSLFSPSAFYPDTVVDSKTGILKKGDRLTQSFVSRLTNLWKGVFQSRREFEEKPDVGFLGKSIVRVFNLIWNYVFKGVIGTVLVVALQPLLTVVNILLSTFLALTSMIWCPVASILVYLFTALIYDFESPIHNRFLPRVFPLFIGVALRKILNGGIQVAGSVVAILGNLLGFILVVAGCGVHTGIRSLYDFLMFYLIIRWRARVPAQNSFAARRIHGPGLSRQAFFQIDPDLALVALQVKMELEELTTYEDAAMTRITQAKRESMKHIKGYLDPLGLSLALSNPVLVTLNATENDLMEKFRKLRKKRNEDFPFLVDSVPNRDRIVLERKDLEITLRRATAAVQHFYSTRVFPMKNKPYQEKFWEDKSLLEGDYAGLARALLSNVFSARFLSPLEEADKSVVLQIHHTGVHQYAEGLMDTGAIPDDLSVSHIEYPNYYQPSILPTVKGWNASYFPTHFSVTADDVLARYKKIKKHNL